MLEVADLAVEIQSSEILRGVSFKIAAGELVCLVGRNGAGKTTTLRTIMGYVAARRGAIRLAGADLTGKSTLDRARLGIGYSPEDSEILGELTVAENIELPTWTRRTEKPASERIELAFRVFPNLRRYAARPGTHLLDAKGLLLDEPFEGLSPAIMPGIRNSVREIVRLGCTVLIAESELQHVPDYAKRIYVMERGEIVFGGSLDEARRDPTVHRILGATL